MRKTLHRRRKYFQVEQQKTVKGTGLETIRDMHLGTKVLGVLVSLTIVFGSLLCALQWLKSDSNIGRPEAAPKQAVASPEEVVYVGRPTGDTATVAAAAVIGTLVMGLGAYDVVLMRQGKKRE